MAINTLSEWKQSIADHWSSLAAQINAQKQDNAYIRAVALAFAPVYSGDPDKFSQWVRLLGQLEGGAALKTVVEHIGASRIAHTPLMTFAASLYKQAQKDGAPLFRALDNLIIDLDILRNAAQQTSTDKAFIQQILEQIRDKDKRISGVSVQAETINAQGNVYIVGRDFNYIEKNYQGSDHVLRAYLSAVRTQWNASELDRVLKEMQKVDSTLKLHQLYTPTDVWRAPITANTEQTIIDLRNRAATQDVDNMRVVALERIAVHPHIVIVGAPGTGKSTLCHYIATALAFACDPEAEQTEHVRGLDLLGPTWIHGVMLPLYVRLRDFWRDSQTFPKKGEPGSATSLIKYLRQTLDTFAPELEKYLVSGGGQGEGAFLLLDGLDEVYNDQARVQLKQIIENWVARFPKCRVLVTSRTYAYRQASAWLLGHPFVLYEMAPYNMRQICQYINHWYDTVAQIPPYIYEGQENARKHTRRLANGLIYEIEQNDRLMSLARQPLLLTLITKIHQTHRELPRHRAELYEKTVDLLLRWNTFTESDADSIKFASLDPKPIRDALQLVAFSLQISGFMRPNQPPQIERKHLIDSLQKQRALGNQSINSIHELVDYLGTRNGILVPDNTENYRFLHLSLQEYLAACALIEQYNECDMPETLKTPAGGWDFPENIRKLLFADPDRWREVALFIGAILASQRSQRERWEYIEYMLPKKLPERGSLKDYYVHSIYVAAETWADAPSTPRLESQKSMLRHLRDCIEFISTDDRLDVPERLRIETIKESIHRILSTTTGSP